MYKRQLDRCRHLSEVLPKATVICGDGTDQELLEEEDVTASDAFVALTDRDEDNLIISLYAMQPVSYTHLDVYKRQALFHATAAEEGCRR